MTNETSRLTLAVDSRQVKSATTDLGRFGKAGKQTETATQGMARSFGALKGALGGLSAALAVRAAIQSADAYSNLNARLKLVTRSATEFAAAQKGVFDIAQGTRTGLTETADLFGNLSRATEGLGASQERILGVTQSINQALQVSGASSVGAAAALTQLGQGFASGALRGEELNSVLDQAPRLARAIADGLGVPIGKLRELGQAGELTAEKVFGALEGSAEKLQKEFDTLPLTVGSATTQVSNAVLKLVGVLDASTGASTSLAEAVGSAAEFIGGLADEIERLNNGGLVDVNNTFGLIAAGITTASEAVRIFAANVAFVLGGVGREFAAVYAQIELVAEVLAAPPGDLIATARRNWSAFNAISEAVKEDGVRARRELDALEKEILGAYKGLQSAAESARLSRQAGLPAPAIPSRTGGGAGDKSSTAAAKRFAEEQRALSFYLRDYGSDESDAEIARLQKYEEVLAALPDVIIPVQTAHEELVNSFLRSEKAAYDQTPEQIEEIIKSIEKADDRTRLFLDNVQKTFGDTLYNTLKGDFDNILSLWADLLLKMAVEAAAADFASALGFGGNSGGGNVTSLATTIASLFGGGRAMGGPVKAGSIYEINENAGPGEVLRSGGKQYLLANQSGIIEPLASGAGAGGKAAQGLEIVVKNIQGQTARVTEQRDGSGGVTGLEVQILELVAADVDRNGRVFQSMKRAGMSRAGNLPRRG